MTKPHNKSNPQCDATIPNTPPNTSTKPAIEKQQSVLCINSVAAYSPSINKKDTTQNLKNPSKLRILS
jgi:hypothetical protein